MFKNAKYKNAGENLYKKKLAVYLVNQRLLSEITSFDLLEILYRIYVTFVYRERFRVKRKKKKVEIIKSGKIQ